MDQTQTGLPRILLRNCTVQMAPFMSSSAVSLMGLSRPPPAALWSRQSPETVVGLGHSRRRNEQDSCWWEGHICFKWSIGGSNQFMESSLGAAQISDCPYCLLFHSSSPGSPPEQATPFPSRGPTGCWNNQAPNTQLRNCKQAPALGQALWQNPFTLNTNAGEADPLRPFQSQEDGGSVSRQPSR